MKIVRKQLSDLHLDPANARVHDKRNRDAIRASLKQFGQVEPIVVQASTGKVIGGNGRVAVLQEMGETEVDVVEVDIDDVGATALGIALNRSAELASWDEDTLGKLLATLQAEPDFDHLVAGFSDAEISKLLGPPPGLTDPDEIPPVPEEPTARPGDLWLLGDHRLLCGDCTDPDAVARLLDGAQPGLAVVDPPYGVSLDAEWRDRAGKNALGPAEPSYMRRRDGHTNTSISGDTISDWSHAFELVPSLRVIYCWHASAHTLEVGLGLRRIGFDLRQMLIWRKPQFVLSRTHYHYATEPCWYAVKRGSTAKWIGTRDQSNVIDAPSPKQVMAGSTEEKVDHPTQKALVCMERPIANHDFPDVYEAFSGGGTTIIACERQRRRCYAMELDAKYVDVAVTRWERFTGRTAQRISP